MTLQSRSELSYTLSTLPNGLSSNQHNITCIVNVYDSLLAYSTDTIAVTVHPVVRSISSLSDLLNNQLNSSSGNLNVQTQILSAVSSVLNVVNCTLATHSKCMGLFRFDCAQTSNTCGACMNGYSGEIGDANTKCVSTNVQSSVEDGSVCQADNDCSIFSYCNKARMPHVCLPQLKSCPGGDCSGHGVCSYRDQSTGNLAATCLQSNSSCVAICICIGNYTTSDCSVTQDDLISKQSMRSTMLSSLVNVTTASNPTAENILTWSNSIASMTQVSQEVTASAASNVMNIAFTILNNADVTTVSGSDLSGTMNALDSVATQVSSDHLLNMVTAYGSITSNSMYPGQSSNDIIKSNFRMSSIVVGTSASSNELTTPLTYVESVSNVKPMKMSLPNNTDNAKKLAVTTIIMDASLYNVSGLNSNPFHMSMNQVPCSGSCSMTFTLSNNAPAAVDIITNPNQLQSFTTTCHTGVIRPITHKCDNGHILHEYCNGSYSGSFVSVCNTNYSMSVCNSLSGTSGISTSGCTVLNYTSTQTVCSCPLIQSSNRRLLINSNSTKAVSVSLVSMISTVASNFESTWVSADKLTGNSILQGIQVLVVTGLIGLLAVIGVIHGYYSDHADEIKLINAQQNKSLEKDVDKLAHRKQLIMNALTKKRLKTSVEEQLIEETLPEALHEVQFSKKFAHALKAKHKWLSIIYHYSAHFPRMLRVLSLATSIISMLFVQAVLYPIAHPDTGVCEVQGTEAACYAQPAAVGSSSSKCYWVVNTDDGGTCHFRPPGDGK